MEKRILSKLAGKYADILIDYDNNISRSESDLLTKQAEVVSTTDKIRVLKEERERILGALGVLMEAEKESEMKVEEEEADMDELRKAMKDK